MYMRTYCRCGTSACCLTGEGAGAQVHERHLNTDLLLALTRALLLQRKDLRVVVMSATINVQALYLQGTSSHSVPVSAASVVCPGSVRLCYPLDSMLSLKET